MSDTSNKWIRVKDAHPDDGRYVLILTQSKSGSQNVDKGYYDIEHGRYITRGAAKVTHWMEIPEFPPPDGDAGTSAGEKLK